MTQLGTCRMKEPGSFHGGQNERASGQHPIEDNAQEPGEETANLARPMICGILSSLFYVAADQLGALQWQGYSMRSQTISEPLRSGRSLRMKYA